MNQFKIIEQNIVLKETNIVSFDNPALQIKRLSAMFKELYTETILNGLVYKQPLISHVKAKKEKKKTR